MNTETIRNLLKQFMSDGEANACRIWKGWDVGTQLSGWHYQRFGETATFMGSNISECEQFVDELLEARRQGL